MAIEKVIKIVGDTSNADKKIDNLTESIDNLSKTTEETGKRGSKSVEKLGKSSDKARKKVRVLSGGFRKLGAAIKATGIGLVISLIAGLTAALSSNQRVLDVFSTVTETVGIVLAKVAEALLNVFDAVTKNTESFDALGKVLGGILTLVLTPLKVVFFSIKLGIQEAQLAWERSFFGGKDKRRIAELTIGILETKQAIFDTGKEALQAGKDIVNNFSEAITETVDIAKKTQEEFSKISIKSAIETAKANVLIKNAAKLAVAEQGRLLEIFDRQAEKQRQIRDEERNSIDDRIKANDELGEVLEKQEKAMLKQADAQIASAKADVDKNNNIENQVALTEALANKEGVLAAVEGFRSEQLVNDLALKREQIELNNLISDSDKERQLKQLEFEASQEKTEESKLQKQRDRLDLENEIILEDLERKRKLFKEGTIARVQAEEDFKNRKQDIDNAILDNTKKVEQSKRDQLTRTSQLLIELGGVAATVGKGIAVYQATISGIEGVQNAYTTAQKSPITALFPAYPLVQAGLAGAFSALQIKKILSTNTSGASGGAGASGVSASAPSFNLVQGTPSNQISSAIANQNQQPIQAYVVGSQITTQQQLDRNKITSSSI